MFLEPTSPKQWESSFLCRETIRFKSMSQTLYPPYMLSKEVMSMLFGIPQVQVCDLQENQYSRKKYNNASWWLIVAITMSI